MKPGGAELKWIDYSSPETLAEALSLLNEHQKDAGILAGGTDLIVKMRADRINPGQIIDIKSIPELNQVNINSNNDLTIGSAIPCYKIYNNDDIMNLRPELKDSASIIGGTQIQGRASFGGNICNAAPSADSVPLLISLGATCNVQSVNGERTIALEDLFSGPGQTVLEPNELLISITIPKKSDLSGANYIRFIPRNEMDIAVVGTGVSVTLSSNKKNFESVRVSLASVGPTPIFVDGIDKEVSGQEINDESIRVVSNMAKNASKPISDMRGTAEFRQHLCEVLTRRALITAIERAKEA
ncbi:MAG: FAD binding domain-containing protein [Dehalococcoidia bacterium]|jgi:CO/xanthine dehydrogenase FAD-binding subunit|nr:FAD binding domain-containing protein [Dehalococcoidia bacterium]|tara:strand:+ start:5757 stop:6653 length:897 start_codon:yes stop_codon:yes gene_type:complete